MTAIQETIGIKGRYRLVECDPSRAPELYEKIVQLTQRGVAAWSEYRTLLGAYHAAAGVAVHEYANLIPTVGRSVLAQRLANTTTYTGIVNYAAVGSSATTPANGDTQLGGEVYRQTLSSQTYVNNIAYLSCFIAAGSATGTHYEAGLFIDGTGAANSGQLFSHVLFSPAVSKAASNSLTLDVSLSID